MSDGACDDDMLETLDTYSLAKCMQRAKNETADSKVWAKCNIDVSKSSFLAKAEKEQLEFEVPS